MSEAQGSLWVCAPGSPDERAGTLSRALEPVPGVCAGASTLSGGAGAIARLLAYDAVALGDAFRAAWRALRCALTGLPRRAAASPAGSESCRIVVPGRGRLTPPTGGPWPGSIACRGIAPLSHGCLAGGRSVGQFRL